MHLSFAILNPGAYSEPMLIQSVGKAAAVLNVLGDADAVSFTEVWQGTGLNKTTVAHLLQTLVEIGYAEKTPDGRYRLGHELLELAQRRLRRMVLRELAEKHALVLAGSLRATVTVATLEAGQRHKLAKASVDAGPVLDDSSERRVDLYTTATGRMLLASADEADRERALEYYGLPGERWPEAADADALAEQLAAIRNTGVAVALSGDGHTQAVAVPIHGPDGRIWAAIGSAIGAVTTTAGSRGHSQALRATAKQFSEDLRLRLGEGRVAPPAEA
jgi:DNA-binding IclR family transcriptional regulator